MIKNRFSASVVVALLGLGLMGCGSKTGIAEPVLAAWEKGDKATAISLFVDADWSKRPLFAPGTTLGLSEKQFQALPPAAIEARIKDIIPRIGELKEVAMAVAQAGRDAAGKKDEVQARKYFTAVKQYAAALESPDCPSLVQSLGQGIKMMADNDLSKLSP